jgi:hypothetical protein
MSWIVAGVTAGIAVIGGIGKGVTAMGQAGDVAAGKVAAGDIYQQQLGLLGEEKTLAGQAIQSQFTGASRDIGFGIQTGQRQIAGATAKTGLATSGTMQRQTSDLLAKAKSDMTKLFETRDLSRASADLSYRKGEMSAEESYQSTLTGLESTPTTFMEGLFG